MKTDVKTVAIWVLATLLLISVGYTGYSVYQNAKQKQQLGLLQSGAQLGYEQAVVQVIQQAATCQAVPLTAGNVTINVVAVECLQAAAQQQAQAQAATQ